MLTMQHRPAPDERTDRRKSLRCLNNRPPQITRLPKKSNPEISLESTIKNWCIDLLAEAYFQGADSLQHKHASLFWARTGRRLKNV